MGMFNFTPAERRTAKLRAALIGASGCGKTLSALYLAYGITGDWGRVALIDTEHERARFYASRSDLGTGAFLYAAMEAPYSPERYKAAVSEAAQLVGPDGCVIVDSFSHAWMAEGGVLDIKDNISARAGQNSYTAWNEAGKEQTSLVNAILSVDCHTIVTMRSKMAYAMELNERGKQQPVKVGLSPIQRDDVEYEFDIVLSLARDHTATASKDVTWLDKYGAVITPDLGRQLKAWLSEGKEPPRCADCGKLIQPIRTSAGVISADEVAARAEKKYGVPLCLECGKSRKEQKVHDDPGQQTPQA